MSIRHYGMKQCFTQYLNLICEAPRFLDAARDAAGSAKVEETKVNLADGMSFFFVHLTGERYVGERTLRWKLRVKYDK